MGVNIFVSNNDNDNYNYTLKKMEEEVVKKGMSFIATVIIVQWNASIIIDNMLWVDLIMNKI